MNLNRGAKANNKTTTTTTSNGIPREDLYNVLDLPIGSTNRLCQLKLAQIELETLRRQASPNELDLLETMLKEETEKFVLLQQIIDKDIKERLVLKKSLLNSTRETQFYQDKLKQTDTNKLERKQADLKLRARQVFNKRNELNNLRRSLDEFRNLEPSNDALKRKIDELRKSRLSLEMTFVDEP